MRFWLSVSDSSTDGGLTQYHRFGSQAVTLWGFCVLCLLKPCRLDRKCVERRRLRCTRSTAPSMEWTQIRQHWQDKVMIEADWLHSYTCPYPSWSVLYNIRAGRGSHESWCTNKVIVSDFFSTGEKFRSCCNGEAQDFLQNSWMFF